MLEFPYFGKLPSFEDQGLLGGLTWVYGLGLFQQGFKGQEPSPCPLIEEYNWSHLRDPSTI